MTSPNSIIDSHSILDYGYMLKIIYKQRKQIMRKGQK